MNPNVLFIDDNENTTIRLLREVFDPRGLSVKLLHPDIVQDSDLDWADVVVIDYFLTDWPDRDDAPSATMSPADGLAVAAVLRSRLLPGFTERYPGSIPERPVAFALWSGHLSEATFGLPDVILPHVFSRENNLEWAFARSELLASDGADRLASLATSVKMLPKIWDKDSGAAEDQLWLSLGLRSTEGWMESAREEVLESKPPLHELALRTRGMAILRWLLHRITPYPTFLIDERYLRARLRVDALYGEDTNISPLLQELKAVEYQGVLSGFSGRRWWRAGVEDWLFSQTGGEAGDPAAVVALATSKGAVVERRWKRPVVVLDEDLKPKDAFEEVEDVVRLNPDDWPPYADDAYASREDASQSTELRRLVHASDRNLLSPRATLR